MRHAPSPRVMTVSFQKFISVPAFNRNNYTIKETDLPQEKMKQKSSAGNREFQRCLTDFTETGKGEELKRMRPCGRMTEEIKPDDRIVGGKNMKKTALVIMAAGIGSRFGGGIKQLEPVGPNGEIIMDYSIHDALEAGFDKIVFIIRKDLEKDFREIIGNRIEKIAPVEYAFQELEDLPEGFSVPEGRKKPWGTGQAVLAARHVIHEPFLVINADDYYGKEGFRRIHDYMVSEMKEDGDSYDMCMAGFILSNTLSENGGVTRGVCTVNSSGYLEKVTETYNIFKGADGMHASDNDGNPVHVEAGQHVSMNMFGLPAAFIKELEAGFPEFLKQIKEGDIKAEYLLPTIIDQCIRSGKASVRILETPDKWFGVTYKEDKPAVVNSIRQLVEAGVYPEKLFS